VNNNCSMGFVQTIPTDKLRSKLYVSCGYIISHFSKYAKLLELGPGISKKSLSILLSLKRLIGRRTIEVAAGTWIVACDAHFTLTISILAP
jgi:hypothetical protein